MSAVDWEGAYASRPHWDLGRPQSAFRRLAATGAIGGRVLDAAEATPLDSSTDPAGRHGWLISLTRR